MQGYSYDDLGEKLVEVIPELRPVYDAELAMWGDEKPGPHVIYGDLLNPYLISLLESQHLQHQASLRRVFAFLEELANHPDIQVQEVVAFTVCERLGANRSWLSAARRYMGETTLRISREVEAFWGSEPEDTSGIRTGNDG